MFLDHRAVVKQRLPHTLGAAFAFLADCLTARAPHVGRQLVFRQRVLALTKQGKQERVGFSDGIMMIPRTTIVVVSISSKPPFRERQTSPEGLN
ncbi:MAG: hypothetical protein E6I42_03545 [Chloroflexi bacterium]|nr:MAG: hypothetical protein E6I42_03545 [Chloroflexota bacterium]